MLSRKPLSAAGTALIGIIALLMSPMAFAVIDMEGEGQQAVTYSQETITTAPISGEDGGSYYVVSGADNELNVRAEVGVGGTVGLELDHRVRPQRDGVYDPADVNRGRSERTLAPTAVASRRSL